MYQIILYGIAGADQQYIAQMYYYLYEEEISIYKDILEREGLMIL